MSDEQDYNAVESEPTQTINLLTYLGNALVSADGEVEVEWSRSGSAVKLTLYVPSPDMGKVIGKGGRIANAIRSLVRVAGAKEGVETTVEFSDTRQ
ncbi:MAG: KH domain-containing protein [Acidimicrobiaceae bacterium]|nr:KH domain-containing protein [Acidimicrobiaceae bacterium]